MNRSFRPEFSPTYRTSVFNLDGIGSGVKRIQDDAFGMHVEATATVS